jgi:signal transduction histidine kinase
VTGIAGRCVLAVLAALALDGLGLGLLALLLGVTPGGGFWLGALLVLALGGALAAAATVGLRADLRAARAFAAQSELEQPVELPAARAFESEPLLSGLAQLRKNFVDLDAAQRRAQREIEEAERVRASFLAAMAHDLRGPLNAVIGFADLLVIEGLDAVSIEQRPSVDLIRRSALDLLVLLDEILEWAKCEAGQIALEREPTALSAIVAEVMREARVRSAGRGLLVQSSVAEDVPELIVDRKRIAQSLLGLLDHATRAPDRPRVALSAWLATDEQGRPSVRIELRDPQLCVREADHQSFFEAFRPSYAPSGKRVSGLGLGPALARALIRAHGGEVWFSSEVDTGTTFVVQLPLSS